MNAAMDPNKNDTNFFDPEVYEVLKRLGFLIPETIEDFKKIEKNIKAQEKPFEVPKIENLNAFINSEPKFIYRNDSTEPTGTLNEIISGFAQAAREGKLIPDYIQKKMKSDKTDSEK